MLLEAAGRPLVPAELPVPEPGPGQVLISVRACGVCRTDLHVVDGELPHPKLPLVLGHEIVGTRRRPGEGARFAMGARVGVPWLGWTCGGVPLLPLGAREPLRPRALHRLRPRRRLRRVRGRRRALLLPAPGGLSATSQAAPLLCAGLIGYRSLRAARAMRSASGSTVSAPPRTSSRRWRAAGAARLRLHAPGRRGRAQAFARCLGAEWAGGSGERRRRRSTPRSSSRRRARSCPRRCAARARRAAPWCAAAST